MKLPGGDNAIVDIAKLRDYCLDQQHPRGRHKARVFAATLGLAQTDAEFLREALLRAAREADALVGESDELFCTIRIEIRDARIRTTLGGGFAGRQQGT